MTLLRLAFLGVAVAGSGALVIVALSYFLSRPAPRMVARPPEGLPAETVAIPSPSGSMLAGWFIAGRPGMGAILLMHGVRGDRLAMAGRIPFLIEADYAVLAFDFQAHGESPGRHITFGHLEALDAAAALDWLKHRLPGEKVGVIGASLGGAAALLGPRPLAVDALVLEAVFPDIDAAVANRFAARFGPAGRWGAPMLLAVAARIIGVRRADLRPIDRIGEVTAPLLVIAGTADERTTIAETRALFARAQAPKELWEIAGAGHVDLADFAGTAYRERIVAFFAQHLRVARVPSEN